MTQLYGGKRPIWERYERAIRRSFVRPLPSSALICPSLARRANQFDRFGGVRVTHSASSGAVNRVRVKSEFRELIQADLGCPDGRAKYFSFPKICVKLCIVRTVPPPQEGRFAHVASRTLGADAVDASVCALTHRSLKRTAKSCGSWRPEAGAKLAKMLSASCGSRWQPSDGHRGGHQYKP